MKTLLTIILPLTLIATSATKAEEQAKEAPKYIAEAPLPKGWSPPGPYNKVIEKKFPAYRAAYTEGGMQNFAFWRLFKHIKNNDIPMTSPVEMDMKSQDGNLKMEAMGFLYQDTKVGKVGADGEKVEVRDIPSMKTLSYTWQGNNNSKNLKLAKAALDTALKQRNLISTDLRVLGYNGPSVSRDKKTWEMLAILPAK
ncbi:MAG: heme-binding protein [Akkermansiaceae bacterium]